MNCETVIAAIDYQAQGDDEVGGAVDFTAFAMTGRIKKYCGLLSSWLAALSAIATWKAYYETDFLFLEY